MPKENCVAEYRVSSLKQSTEGESLESQDIALRRFIDNKGWNLVPNGKIFGGTMSGRKENRESFEEAILYIKKHPELKVKYYVFKSIDRFTRAGSGEYERMKRELSALGVEAVDLYGIIQPSRNTLEEFDMEYKWSRYFPSETAEVIEVTRAKSEVRDILTRMIGQSIRNTQKGYRARRPTDGFLNQKIFDESGKKKYIQVPNPERAKYRIAMFELRAQGLSDEECVKRVNAMGYHSPIYYKWNKAHNKIIGQRGGKPLTIKQFQRDIQNPIYAGVVCEKWTHYKPIRAQYPGLVSIELWNQANRGKIALLEIEDGTIELVNGFLHGTGGKVRMKYNPLFPYKFVLCPVCSKPVLGSSPRGKLGKPHPTYHCARKHKYFGVKKEAFEKSVSTYIRSLKFDPKLLAALEVVFMNKFRHREKEIVLASGHIHQNIADLENEQATKLEAYTSSKSAVIREKLEKEIEALEERIKSARKERLKIQITRDDIKSFMQEAKTIMEHPAEILLNQKDLRVQRDLFSLVFEKIPTYLEIVNGTPKLSLAFRLSSDYLPDQNHLVTPPGIEPGF